MARLMSLRMPPIDLAQAEGNIATVDDFNYATWNCETHASTSFSLRG